MSQNPRRERHKEQGISSNNAFNKVNSGYTSNTSQNRAEQLQALRQPQDSNANATQSSHSSKVANKRLSNEVTPQKVHEAIIDLYLQVKIRSNDEVSSTDHPVLLYKAFALTRAYALTLKPSRSSVNFEFSCTQ